MKVNYEKQNSNLNIKTLVSNQTIHVYLYFIWFIIHKLDWGIFVFKISRTTWTFEHLKPINLCLSVSLTSAIQACSEIEVENN